MINFTVLNNGRIFTTSSKTKLVIEALSERFTIREPADKYEVNLNQIWAMDITYVRQQGGSLLLGINVYNQPK